MKGSEKVTEAPEGGGHQVKMNGVLRITLQKFSSTINPTKRLRGKIKVDFSKIERPPDQNFAARGKMVCLEKNPGT